MRAETVLIYSKCIYHACLGIHTHIHTYIIIINVLHLIFTVTSIVIPIVQVKKQAQNIELIFPKLYIFK